MRIGFSTDGKSGEVHLYLDSEGRNFLVESLKALEFPENNESHEHFHLFSEDWGGYDLDMLTDKTLEVYNSTQGHHLKVYMRPSQKDVWKNEELD